jgi:hypothetical protein
VQVQHDEVAAHVREYHRPRDVSHRLGVGVLGGQLKVARRRERVDRGAVDSVVELELPVDVNIVSRGWK